MGLIIIRMVATKIQHFPAKLYIHHICSMLQTQGEKDLIWRQTGPEQHTGASTVQQLGFYIIYNFYTPAFCIHIMSPRYSQNYLIGIPRHRFNRW